MSSFMDKLKNKAQQAIKTAANELGNQSMSIVIDEMPSSLEEFKSLPQAALNTPFDTAALTVVAFNYYPLNKELALEMLDYLKGPKPLSTMEKQFIRDRFMDKDYVPRSYFVGATPANNYEPSEPYTIIINENPYSYQNEGYATLYIHSGGADNPRSVQLRQAKDGKWYLWEQYLLVDIRKPESEDPWA